MTDRNVVPSKRRRGRGCVGIVAIAALGGVVGYPFWTAVDTTFNDARVTSTLEGWSPHINSGSQEGANGGSLSLPEDTPSAKPSGKASQRASSKPSASKSADGQKIIAIDPAYSGSEIDSDPSNTKAQKISAAAIKVGKKTYHIRDHDYPDAGMKENFKISSCVGKALSADGYKVVLTKDTADATVSLADRAARAESAGGEGVPADMAVTVRVDHGKTPEDLQTYYTQLGAPMINGKYGEQFRTSIEGKRIVFSNEDVAQKSADYGAVIGAARSKSQGYDVKESQSSLEGGNIRLVQALAEHTPWIDNAGGAETGGSPSTPLSAAAMTSFGVGLVNGIEQALPPDNGAKLVGAKSVAGCIG